MLMQHSTAEYVSATHTLMHALYSRTREPSFRCQPPACMPAVHASLPSSNLATAAAVLSHGGVCHHRRQ